MNPTLVRGHSTDALATVPTQARRRRHASEPLPNRDPLLHPTVGTDCALFPVTSADICQGRTCPITLEPLTGENGITFLCPDSVQQRTVPVCYNVLALLQSIYADVRANRIPRFPHSQQPMHATQVIQVKAVAHRLLARGYAMHITDLDHDRVQQLLHNQVMINTLAQILGGAAQLHHLLHMVGPQYVYEEVVPYGLDMLRRLATQLSPARLLSLIIEAYNTEQTLDEIFELYHARQQAHLEHLRAQFAQLRE